MTCIVRLITLAFVTHCFAVHGWNGDYDDPNLRQGKKVKILNLDKTNFQTIGPYAVGASSATEQQYPWLARVVHSPGELYPHACTAAAVEKRIFITAARCIANLKVQVTTVLYQKFRFAVKVFVIPSNPSKQMFDDIGIILVEEGSYKKTWPTINVFDGKRTDVNFQWLSALNFNRVPHKVIGYVTTKHFHKMATPDMKFEPKQLDVIVSPELCHKLYGGRSEGAFFVPCYHSCKWSDMQQLSPNCSKYLAAEGAVVYNVQTKKLLGVATWAVYMRDMELPVGFAVPNSDSYFKDIACARKIRDNTRKKPTRGYYQALCME